MRATMMTTPLTLDRLLERAGTLFGDVEVVSRRPDRSLHRYRYRDMYARARQLAKALIGAGVRPGDRVATLMWNHAAHLEAYFGVPAAAAVLHTLNLRLFPEDIAYIARHAEDRFLIVDDVLLPLYESFKDQVDFERVFVVPYGGPVPAGYESYEELLATGVGDFEYPTIDEGAPCGMCYTSGTTGRPKGVVYAHRSSVLHALGMSLPDAVSLSFRDTVLPVVPMFHANAWGIPYAAAMVGARQVLPGPHLDAESLLELFADERVTVTGGVPTIWMGVLKALREAPERWRLTPGMRMLVGGSATPPSLIDAFDEFDLNIVAAWGLTETSPLASVSNLRPELDARPEAERLAYRARAGVPLPLCELRIAGDEGIAPWDGASVGEIEIRGPWITARYHERPDAADRFSDDGWFRTGDVAYMTPEGYISITDRAKDLIKSGGEWISSQALENELMAHPEVAEAAVIAVPHERWMERPLAVVVLRPGATVGDAELRAHLDGKFARWWLPDAFVYIDAIPRTSTGKFQKLRLRERFGDWDRIDNVIQPAGAPRSED
ncbi:MAG: long-chain fatty acid--CoA ligase [Myxococcales bacterium]|nr:long-chain fatty acid--CoA ligase [Myxococcales bacterium]MCB9701243.1 long-chain fatty acid--CoA ligase [Myxococcales bacterium]